MTAVERLLDWCKRKGKACRFDFDGNGCSVDVADYCDDDSSIDEETDTTAELAASALLERLEK